MDLATMLGLLLGIFCVVFGVLSGGGSLKLFINPPSMLIVIGGTIGATFLNYPLNEVLGVVKVVKNAFLQKEESPGTIIDTLVSFAETARREGILSLEQQAQTLDDDFLKNGINLAVDGTEPEYIKEIMATELDYISERHKAGAGIFDSMALYAPAFGMIGTLIGLIFMLGSMDNPAMIASSMAIALVTTFYGAVLSNIIFLPIAGKLKERSNNEIVKKEMILTGIMSIQSGDIPGMVEQRMVSFLPTEYRKIYIEKNMKVNQEKNRL